MIRNAAFLNVVAVKLFEGYAGTSVQENNLTIEQY